MCFKFESLIASLLPSASKLTHTTWQPLSLTSRMEYLFWWMHLNSSPIRIFLNASKMGFLMPYFVVWIRKLHNRPSMTMSLRQSQGGTTCKPQISWVPFLFPHHMESTQLYESQSFSIMLQMMNLTRKAIPHCIFNVTYLGNSTISLLGICSTRCRPWCVLPDLIHM